MFRLNSFFRFLSRNRLYTTINVGGLALSLMVVILITNYAVTEFSVDKQHSNKDNIYLLANDNNTHTAYGIGERIANQFAGIEKICQISNIPMDIPVTCNDKSVYGSFIAVDTTFFSMFSFSVIEGDRHNLVATKNDVAISKSFATKLFGSESPVGKTINVGDDKYNVTGVYNDFANSAIANADMVFNMEFMRIVNPGMLNNYDNAGSLITFLQTTPNANILQNSDKVKEFLKEFFWVYERGMYNEVRFIPLQDVYFSKTKSVIVISKGDKSFTMILLFAGFVILTLSLFNYINLTVAQSGFRAKEFATNRLYGASKTMVIIRMLTEATLLTGVAFLLGLFFAFATQNNFNTLVGGNGSIVNTISFEWIAIYVLFIVAVGAITGIIPATIIQRFKPIDVIKGEFTYRTKMVISKVFIVIQSIISIVFIGYSLITYNQVSYLINADLGFNQDNIIHIDIMANQKHANIAKEEFLKLPFVEAVGLTEASPINIGNNNFMDIDVNGAVKLISFQRLVLDNASKDILGIKILHNNNNPNEIYLNQTALKFIEGNYNTTTFMQSGAKSATPIAGIYNDFIFGNYLTSTVVPQLMYINDNIREPWDILIKVSPTANRNDSYNQVREAYKKATGFECETATWVDEKIQANYKRYKSTANIMLYATFIAILISSLGLFAISTYYIQQRAKEIALRKVLGSNSKQILWRFIMQFLRLVALAVVIACPIIWYAGNRWLQQFANRTEIQIWVFLVSVIVIFVVSVATLFFQCHHAANRNPIEAIKK